LGAASALFEAFELESRDTTLKAYRGVSDEVKSSIGISVATIPRETNEAFLSGRLGGAH
jgi:hypothetical protein